MCPHFANVQVWPLLIESVNDCLGFFHTLATNSPIRAFLRPIKEFGQMAEIDRIFPRRLTAPATKVIALGSPNGSLKTEA